MNSSTSSTTPNKVLTESENKFPVVGVGASAGGLKAFKHFIEAIPKDSGMAFVLVQHLDPNHDSLLPELLQKITELTVLQISDEITVEPNNIYIIPSNKMLLSNDGHLELEPRNEKDKKGRRHVIDLFFTSLAEVHRSHSIGIVLTGTGSDGTQGLKAIKAQGGITFAQDLESAEFDGMPRSAIDAGVVDFAITPDKIPEKILQVVQKIDSKTDKDDKQEFSRKDNESLKKIFSLLRDRKGTDFTYYKQTTVHRRILRRMALNNKENLTGYLQQLKSEPQEVDVLYQDLLIPVTNFFRDETVFNNLCNAVFPAIIKNKEEKDPIRIWSAGCSTGQEVYTLAICLLEHLDERNAKEKIQIFGTDISEPAIEKARKGIYDMTEVEGVSTERLKRFFTKTDGSYEINKQVREICVFALHNFLNDPPFGKMDLISCRNVLIYMQPFLQKKALTTFHYALKPKGHLLLGKSESIGQVPELFARSEKWDKLFVRKGAPGEYRYVKSRRSEQDFRDLGVNSKSEHLPTDFQRIADEIILNNYTPAGVVVNEAMDIVHFRGKTAKFLEQSSGKPTHNLFKMAKTELVFELRTILHKFKKKQQNNKGEKVTFIKEHIPIEVNHKKHYISIEVVSLPQLADPHCLILFHDHGPERSTNIAPGPKKGKDQFIKQLQQELSQTREDMRNITNDQDAANEELQSANEELQSGSEELQSLNEELETSQEELQSTNEELSSVNQELIGLNSQLKQAKDYSEAIIETIREPLLVLDKNLRVKSANKNFYKTFKVREQETVGHLVFELGNNQWDIPALRTLLEAVLPEKKSFFDFEVSHNFQNIGERTILVNANQLIQETEEEKLILLSLNDITDYKKKREEELYLKRIRNFFMQAPAAIAVVHGPEHVYTLSNSLYQKLFNRSEEELMGKTIREVFPEIGGQGIYEVFESVFETGKAYVAHEFPAKFDRSGHGVFETGYFNFIAHPIKDSDGKVTDIMIHAFEVTEQILARKKIEENERKYHELIHSSPSLIATFMGEDHSVGIANNAILDAWGKGRDIIGKPLLETLPELKEQGFEEILKGVYETGTPYKAFEMPVDILRNGVMERSYYNFIYYPQRDVNNNITGIVDIATEVTPQAIFNKKLKESESRFRQMADLMPAKVLNTDEEGNAYYFNRHWLNDTGKNHEELEGRGWQQCIHPDDFKTFITAWKESLKTGKEFEMEFRCANKNGDYKWHLGRAVPIKNDDGKIKIWINSAIDIQKLKDEEKRKEDFLKLVSHELKTPVTSIKGYVQMLLSMLSDEKKRNLSTLPVKPSLERIDTQLGRLTRLISEMLDLTRLEDNKLEFKRSKFSLNELVDETIQDISHSNTNQKIKVEHNFKCSINADKDRIGQVLINLITNSIKYSSNSQPVEVKVEKGENMSTGQAGNYVVVSVKDQGIGIAKKDLKKIFDRFYRVAGKDEDTYAGFGIGLFLSNEIIQRHNGTISVESEKGKGSVFSFSLPCGS